MATIKDVVLIHLEDTPVSFARIESILPDHKKDWYQIKLLMLQIPLQSVTWILKDQYINGEDFFMNGKKMRLELVECPADDTFVPEQDPVPPVENSEGKASKEAPSSPSPDNPEKKGKIISFADLKSNKSDPDIG